VAGLTFEQAAHNSSYCSWALDQVVEPNSTLGRFQAFLRDQTTSRDDHREENDFAATFVEQEEDEDTLAFNLQVARKVEEDQEVCAHIDDEPMARVREIQKRMREEQSTLQSAAPAPSIAGVAFQKKKPRGSMFSMDELRALRDSLG